MVFGANLNWRDIAVVGELIKAVTSAIANLVNPSVPKYTRTILFLRVTAYILR